MKLTFETTKKVADGVVAELGVPVKYLIGTMIEVPRAALIADQLARYAEFFSFGTNDLTQMTYGYSRDDVGKFLPHYLDKGLLANDPFSVLDQEGVGELIRIGIPSSVEFCHRVRMSYVSCSPFMIPIARLSAAQARIKERDVMGGGSRG
jgi:pyruvate,orthophosphate dikinase